MCVATALFSYEHQFALFDLYTNKNILQLMPYRIALLCW
jgi:hypothetical protein